MKFRNPFIGTVMKASRRAARKATNAMQRRAVASAVSILRTSLKQRPRMQPPDNTAPSPTVDRRDGSHEGANLKKGLPGQFVTRSLTNAAGTRKYKLYIPTTYTGQALPLLIMLHGCSQNPDDFAAGTRMNAVAEQNGCFVAYPAQAKSANGHRCWNWFSAIDQQRDKGEASIIADITRKIVVNYGCDRRRVFVAGLSAGGAMAVIMGNRYPDLYCAVGVHSGLPYAAARDLPTAMDVMRRGVSKAALAGSTHPLPVIVFHGERDQTVHPRNGERIVEQALAHIANTVREEQDIASGGGIYTRAVYENGASGPMAELWKLHGVAHAWSGGSAHGSYTDAAGPDASAEMMRFFKTTAAI
ncbi:MAG: Esterase [Herbaspirillum sp.]|nr:Esterase [Herbaspirillum sp.]